MNSKFEILTPKFRVLDVAFGAQGKSESDELLERLRNQSQRLRIKASGGVGGRAVASAMITAKKYGVVHTDEAGNSRNGATAHTLLTKICPSTCFISFASYFVLIYASSILKWKLIHCKM